jgi:two-component system sensor histidine kinase KdpD
LGSGYNTVKCLSRRRSPDELLAEIEMEERRSQRGQLKVFLGYASGVGKSFQMLDEGRRRRERGEDVVVCALQPDYPSDIRAILEHLEVIPTVRKDGRTSLTCPPSLAAGPESR